MEEQANKIVEAKWKIYGWKSKRNYRIEKLGADLASKDIQGVVEEFKEMNEKMEKTKKELTNLLRVKPAKWIR